MQITCKGCQERVLEGEAVIPILRGRQWTDRYPPTNSYVGPLRDDYPAKTDGVLHLRCLLALVTHAGPQEAYLRDFLQEAEGR